MAAKDSNAKMITRLMLKMLPIQVLLNAVGAINGIVSSLFASNFVGVDAMSAVGLYSPINMFVTAVSLMLVGGATILCGKHFGENQQKAVNNVFSLSIISAAVIAIAIALSLVFVGATGFTGFLTDDPAVKLILRQYLMGQAIGILPLMIGNELASFLTLENRMRRTTVASIVYIFVNIGLNYIFVQKLHMEALGLALATAFGLWVFFLVQAQYFVSKESHLHFTVKDLMWDELKEIIHIGYPGAMSNIYQTFRGLAVNKLITIFVGSAGLSAFAASDNFLRVIWAFPIGMLAVSRVMMSVAVGEEDRKTLTDVMRVMFKVFIPIQAVICALIIIFAVPLTEMFYQDPSEPVYMMTVWGFRILPLCMPLSIIFMHFTCYGEIRGDHFYVHMLSLLDGIVDVVVFTALLISFLGMNSVYIANVINGLVTTLVIVLYAMIKRGRFPANMEDLMVIPKDFGVPESDRMDISVKSMDEVVNIAKLIEDFCEGKGTDHRRAYLAGLAMEELAGNVVEYGFKKDKKPHSIDVRVVHKGDDIILRLKDDCMPFDPGERQKMADPEDVTKNIGLRMIFGMARDVQYQNLLGMNVLTVRI